MHGANARDGLRTNPEQSGHEGTRSPDPHRCLTRRPLALWGLVGSSASLTAIAREPDLLGLARNLGPHPEAPGEQLALAAREAITRACQTLDDPDLAVEPRYQREGAAVLALLGLATGYHAAPLHRRRDGAAGLLGYEVGTAFKTRPGVRSHAQNAVYAVAGELFAREVEARTKATPGLVSTQRPEVTALSIDLLRRYESYYSMYTPLTALRADLMAALGLRHDGDDELNRFRDFVVSSLHAYAEFLVAKRAFMTAYHGVWIFAQADIEKAVADAIKFIEHFSGLRYREESVLRLEQAEHGELHRFAENLETTTEGRQALARWRGHIEACTCDLDQPTGDCRMHRLIRAAEYYVLVLDTDWYRMMPWHSGPPPNLEAVDPANLYRDVGLGGALG